MKIQPRLLQRLPRGVLRASRGLPRPPTCRTPCLRALLVRRFFALLLFLRSYAPWPSSRASGLSGLFEVWLALPECAIVSLIGRVSLRCGFAAGLPPAAFTSVYCCAYSVSLLRSFHPSCRSSPVPCSSPFLLCGLLWSASLAFSSLLSSVCCHYCALAALTRFPPLELPAEEGNDVSAALLRCLGGTRL